MPLRAPKMYGFIFGFQRLVWWPKCTPASRSSFIVGSGILSPEISVLRLHPSRGAKQTPLVALPKGSRRRNESRRTAAGLLAHRGDEFLVGLGVLHLVEQEFHGLDGVQLGEEPAQDDDPVQDLPAEQQLFLPGSRPIDVHRGEGPLVDEPAI